MRLPRLYNRRRPAAELGRGDAVRDARASSRATRSGGSASVRRRRCTTKSRRCDTPTSTATICSATPDFVDNPVSKLISKDYTASIRAAIDPDQAARSSDLAPGKPPHEGENTTHYSIVDKWGNAVAVTYSLNDAFGAGMVAGDTGVLLNNTMDDFTAKVGRGQHLRPRSGREERDRAVQDAAELDVADDRDERRQACAGRRDAWRKPHHHRRLADDPRCDRLRYDDHRGRRRPAHPQSMAAGPHQRRAVCAFAGHAENPGRHGPSFRAAATGQSGRRHPDRRAEARRQRRSAPTASTAPTTRAAGRARRSATKAPPWDRARLVRDPREGRDRGAEPEPLAPASRSARDPRGPRTAGCMPSTKNRSQQRRPAACTSRPRALHLALMRADPLLQPFTLKHLTVRNRLMSSAHEPAYTHDGMPKQRYRAYHVEKAKGGIGLTMIGGSAVVAPDSPQAFGNILLLQGRGRRLVQGARRRGA